MMQNDHKLLIPACLVRSWYPMPVLWLFACLDQNQLGISLGSWSELSTIGHCLDHVPLLVATADMSLHISRWPSYVCLPNYMVLIVVCMAIIHSCCKLISARTVMSNRNQGTVCSIHPVPCQECWHPLADAVVLSVLARELANGDLTRVLEYPRQCRVPLSKCTLADWCCRCCAIQYRLVHTEHLPVQHMNKAAQHGPWMLLATQIDDSWVCKDDTHWVRVSKSYCCCSWHGWMCQITILVGLYQALGLVLPR